MNNFNNILKYILMVLVLFITINIIIRVVKFLLSKITYITLETYKYGNCDFFIFKKCNGQVCDITNMLEAALNTLSKIYVNQNITINIAFYMERAVGHDLISVPFKFTYNTNDEVPVNVLFDLVKLYNDNIGTGDIVLTILKIN